MALECEHNEIYYSPVSLREISIKYAIGKLFLNGIVPEELYQEVENSFLICKPLENEELITAYRLPQKHRDPFDRMIIWQAIKSGMQFLSVDTKMNDYVAYGLKLFEQ